MEKITITVKGWTARSVEEAERASFYGINGSAGACAIARRDCAVAVEEMLYGAGIAWSWLQVLSARSLDTTGTKTPYLAEITAEYSPV